MLNTEEIRNQLNEFEAKYPKSFKIVRGESDFEILETVVSKKANNQVFETGDDAIIHHISQCFQEGKDIVVQAAGKEKVMVHSAKGLFSKKEGGCFIATAIYGTPYASEVITLKEFRDKWLLTFILGKAFVKLYYIISPPIAYQIAKRQKVKQLTKIIVIIPLIKFANILKRRRNHYVNN